QMGPPGSNVTFTVGVFLPAGVTASYQWRTNGVNVGNGGNVSQATTATLALTGAQYFNAGTYSVRVTDSTGTVLDSSEARLFVNGNAPVVTQDPSSTSTASGGTAV